MKQSDKLSFYMLCPWPAQQQNDGIDGDDGNAKQQSGNYHQNVIAIVWHQDVRLYRLSKHQVTINPCNRGNKDSHLRAATGLESCVPTLYCLDDAHLFNHFSCFVRKSPVRLQQTIINLQLFGL